jgi:hypothetical protein
MKNWPPNRVSVPARFAKLLETRKWPHFTEEQVSFLEDLFPVRCLQPGEPVEVHLRHAGMVELISLLRANVAAEAYRSGVGAEDVADHEETWEQARASATKTTEVEVS